VDAGKSRHPELVDYFALDGSWWLPDSPDHRVSGTLTFNAEGLALVAYGSLVPTVRVPNAVLEQTVPDWEETTVILGRSHGGEKVTLLGASGANFNRTTCRREPLSRSSCTDGCAGHRRCIHGGTVRFRLPDCLDRAAVDL